MKKIFVLACLTILLAIAASPCFADSPVTESDIHRAYLDYDIVNKAESTGQVNQEIADYLSAPNNPIGVKAAVINALGWEPQGKNNAGTYSLMVYGKAVKDLDQDALRGDELFCLGYLTVMDDYDKPASALPLLAKARMKMPDSFTAALIEAMVKGQQYFDDQDQWSKIWQTADAVVKDSSLKQDLRTEAARIIVDYMSSYSGEPVLNAFSDKNIMVLYIGDPSFVVNGQEFEIDPGRGTKPEIKNSRTFLPISPLVKVLGGTTSWDGSQKKVTIELGERKLELWIDLKKVTANGKTTQLEAAPYISNSRTMLPLRFIVENLGCAVDWNGELKEVTITVPNPNYQATAGELLSIGQSLFEWEDYTTAVEYFNRATAINPSLTDAYVSKAAALIWLGEYEEAVKAASKAISLDPANVSAYNHQASAYISLEQYEDALDSADIAIGLAPQDAGAYNNKGTALFYLKKYTEALSCYDMTISLDPGAGYAYSNKGHTYYQLGRYEEAIQSYDQSIQTDPYYADAYFSKGDTLYVLGRYQEAVDSFNSYIELNPEFALAYYENACALAYLNRDSEALENLAAAIELDPSLKGTAAGEEAFANLKDTKGFKDLVK